MIIIRIIISIIVTYLFIKLFQKASGSLKLSQLNMISSIFYFLLGYNVIGGSLIYIGIRNHYLVQKIRLEDTIIKTYVIMAYTVILLPVFLILIRRILSHYIARKDFRVFSNEEVEYNINMKPAQLITIILTIVCLSSVVYTFYHIGYIPIVRMFTAGSELNYLRQAAARGFKGNLYIKNILMLLLTPYLSYFAYIYMRITKEDIWRLLFFILCMLSILALTYDFSKSPIIMYAFGIYLIEVSLGNIKNSKTFSKFLIPAIIVVIFFYSVMIDAGDSILSFTNGPIGRILFTQIATLFLHVQVFPEIFNYLNGASFNSWLSFIIPKADGIRSGRVVMNIYNAKGVETNSAGVMNTMFVGEAYANYGFVGVLIAPIIFGLIIGFWSYFLPSMRKKPTTVLLYVGITKQLITIVEGGFIDIIYNFSIIFIVALTILLELCSNHNYSSSIEYYQNNQGNNE